MPKGKSPKKKNSPAPSAAVRALPPKAAKKAKRGSRIKARPTVPGPDKMDATGTAPSPASAAPPTEPAAYVPPPDFKPPEEFAFWSTTDHNELAEAWLGLNERHQKFFTAWYMNGYNGTAAYVETYKQENRHVARVCASQLLALPNILRLRRAIWVLQAPPIEMMAGIEHAALEADESTDPKAYKTHLMKLSAVKSIREFHKLLPAQDVNLHMKGKVKHEHEGTVEHKFDTSELGDLLNGGA